MEAVLLLHQPGPAAKREALPREARQGTSTLFLINGALFATWVSRIPAIETERGLSHAELGLALFGMASGAIIAMPLTGVVIAKTGSDRVCRWAVLIYSGLLPLLALAPNITLFVMALFAFGGAHGALDVAMNSQAVVVEKAYRRPIMASFHALYSTGGLIGAAAGGGLALLQVAPVWHFILMAMLAAITGSMASKDLYRRAALEKGPSFALPNPGLVLLGMVALCIMVGEGAVADWSGIYLKSNLHTSEALAAIGFFAFSVAMATGRFLGDRVIHRFGPVSTVRGGGIVAITALLLVLSSSSWLMALFGFAGVGLGFATVIPAVFSAAGRRRDVPAGVALASVTTLGYLGFLIGPPVIGLGAEFLGLKISLGILLGTTLLATSLAATVNPPAPVSA